MPSIIEGYNYDIFISYRQKDNKGDRWVSEFVEALKTELESTFKEEISVYFDINPHDGLLETHDVDASLKEKLKCLVFIPIISRTFCDPKSFAWEHEFKAFVEQASQDQFGLKVKLPNGNVASRVLPVRIYDLNNEDIKICETVLGGVLRGVEFIYSEPGVNRPLKADDDEKINLNKIKYRNQINKIGNAIEEIIQGLSSEPGKVVEEKIQVKESHKKDKAEEIKEAKGKPAKARRVRFLIPIILVPLLIIGAVVLTILKKPGIRDNLNAMTRSVTVINENGEKEVRRVFKERYLTKLMVYPFTNETNEESNNWLQSGLVWAIWQDLIQFNYMRTETTPIGNLQAQIKNAKTSNYPSFLTGTFRVSDGIYLITSKLYQTSNGSVISERIFKGKDFFSIIDSISLQTRIDVGIPENILNNSLDLSIKEHTTTNLDAFRYWVTGEYIDSAALNFHKAAELDSTFARVLLGRAKRNFVSQQSYESASLDINQAMRHRKRLPEYFNIGTQIRYYLIRGETDKAIALSEMQYHLQPNSFQLSDLALLYESNFLIPKFENAAKRLNELFPSENAYQAMLGRSYLLSGKYDKGLDLMRNLLKDSPEYAQALLLMGEIYLHKKDYEAARKCYEKVILLQPANEKNLSKIFDHISYSLNNSVKQELIKPVIGNYRFENGEMTLTLFIHNNFLNNKAKSQQSYIMYPVSDTQFIRSNGNGRFTFVKNDRDKVVKCLYYSGEQFISTIWKEDSLILKAMTLLNGSDKTKALYAFREAYTHNPEHFYLANFIRHLEFIQSQEYERIKPVLETCTGKYGDRMIFQKNDMLFYEDFSSYIYKLLPLAESQFMLPSFYNRTIRIVRKNNLISGLEIIYLDGRKEFFTRNN